MPDLALLDATLTGVPTRDLVEAVSAERDEPAWLRDHRLRALAHYEALDWPSSRAEQWRHTPLAEAPLERWRLLGGAGPTPAALAGLAGAERAGLLSHVDGGVVEQELAEVWAAQGVLLLPLSQAAREHEGLVRPHLNAIVPLDSDRFTALSGALWSQGLFCYIPPGLRVDGTIYHLAGKTAEAAGVFGHTLIVVAEGAQVTLAEASASDPAAGATLAHRTVEIAAQAGAAVNYVAFENWGDDVYAFSTVRARLGREADVVLGSAAFGARLNREHVEVDVSGERSHATLLSVFVGTGQQHLEYHTCQTHDGEGGRSELIIKGALDDDARAVQYGLIRVTPQGQRTKSEQTMRNLLLSDGAGANPTPILEIEADDVQCSHAAAVGPVDPEQLFYIQSRGISADDAERLVVHGFITVVVDRLPDAHIREVIERMVEEKL